MAVTLHDVKRETVPKVLADRWRKIPVAVTVDLDPSISQIDPLLRSVSLNSDAMLFGPVVTAKCEPPDFGAVLHSLDVLESGDVLLISATGHAGHAMIGDILSGHLRSQGIAGVVCDGAVRDVDTLRAFDDFPIYARSVNPRGPTSAEKGAINAPVNIGDVLIEPGDFIMGDADGLVALSVRDMAQYIDAAEARLVQETEWQERLAKGETIPEIFDLEKPTVK